LNSLINATANEEEYNMKKKIFMGLAVCLLFLSGCEKKEESIATLKPNYNQDVEAIEDEVIKVTPSLYLSYTIRRLLLLSG